MNRLISICLANGCARRLYLSPTTAGKLCNSCLGRIGRMVASDWLAWAVPWYSLNVAVAWQLNVAVQHTARWHFPGLQGTTILQNKSGAGLGRIRFRRPFHPDLLRNSVVTPI